MQHITRVRSQEVVLVLGPLGPGVEQGGVLQRCSITRSQEAVLVLGPLGPVVEEEAGLPAMEGTAIEARWGPVAAAGCGSRWREWVVAWKCHPKNPRNGGFGGKGRNRRFFYLKSTARART